MDVAVREDVLSTRVGVEERLVVFWSLQKLSGLIGGSGLALSRAKRAIPASRRETSMSCSDAQKRPITRAEFVRRVSGRILTTVSALLTWWQSFRLGRKDCNSGVVRKDFEALQNRADCETFGRPCCCTPERAVWL